MKDIKVDSTLHELIIENGDLVLTNDIDTITQNLKIRLWVIFGEWFLDSRIGVRYFENILVKNPNLPQIETLLKDCILQTEGINKLLLFNLSYDPKLRTAVVTFQADTDFGPINFQSGI